MKWISVALDREKWQVLLNMLMDLCVPQSEGIFLTSKGTINLSGRTLLHGVRLLAQLKRVLYAGWFSILPNFRGILIVRFWIKWLECMFECSVANHFSNVICLYVHSCHRWKLWTFIIKHFVVTFCVLGLHWGFVKIFLKTLWSLLSCMWMISVLGESKKQWVNIWKKGFEACPNNKLAIP
jgi:hypothetical protein